MEDDDYTDPDLETPVEPTPAPPPPPEPEPEPEQPAPTPQVATGYTEQPTAPRRVLYEDPDEVAAAAPEKKRVLYEDPDDSAWTAFGREVAHGVGPAAGGAIIGAGTGAAAGALGLNPITAGIGAIGGAIVGGYGADVAQEAGLRAAGVDDAATRRANEAAHPWATYGGKALSNIAGGAAGIGKAAVTAGARLFGGGIGAAWETGVAVHEGKSFKEALPAVASSAVGGAVFAGGRPWTRKAEEYGARAGTAARPYLTTPQPPPPPAAPPPGPTQPGVPNQQWTGPPQDVPAAPPPAQGTMLGAGEHQIGMDLQPPAPPPARQGPELPLEPRGVVDAEGQYGFNIAAADPRNASRGSMPPAGGVAKEAAPPSTGTGQPRNDERYAGQGSFPEARGWANEPEQRPHSVVSQGVMAGLDEVPPRQAAGINVLQPGQIDPTLSHGMIPRTDSPRGGPPRVEPPPPPPPRPQAPPIERGTAGRNPDWQGAPAPIPRDQQVIPRPPDSTQAVMREPPVPRGHVRMYNTDAPRAFTTDRATAERFGPLRHVDVPHGQMAHTFRPGREPGSFVGHRIWDTPAWQRRVRPTQGMPTQPTQRQWPVQRAAEPPPPAAPLPAPPPARGGPRDPGQPRGGPKVASPDLDARINQAVGRAVAPAPPAARAQTGYSREQANQLANRRDVLNREAARRGMRPEALRAEAMAILKSQESRPAPPPAPPPAESARPAKKSRREREKESADAREEVLANMRRNPEPPDTPEPPAAKPAEPDYAGAAQARHEQSRARTELEIEHWAEQGGAKGSRNAKASEYVYLRDKLEKEGKQTDKERARMHKLRGELQEDHRVERVTRYRENEEYRKLDDDKKKDIHGYNRMDEVAANVDKDFYAARSRAAEPAEPPAAKAAKAVRPRKAAPAANEPRSLHQHIRKLGGIKPDDKGELAAALGGKGSGLYLALARKNGMPLDRVWENVAKGAPEERYLPEKSDLNDLLRALGEKGGREHYPAGEEGHVPKAKQDRIADENAHREALVADNEKAVDKYLADPDHDLADFQEGMRQRMYDLMEEGKARDPADAYEQAARELDAQRDFEGDVGPPKEIKPAAEKGADNKPQEVMFAKDEKTAAQRATDAPLRPKTSQKGSDFGMFADRQDDLLDLAAKPSDEAKLKAAGDKFSSELHKAEKAAEDAGKSRDDYHEFLSDEGKAALKENTRLAEIVEGRQFDKNYEKLNDMLPEGYTATREKHIRMYGDEKWMDLEGDRHDLSFDIRDKNGEMVGSISGVHLFDKDIKNGWFKELLDTGHADPVHEKAMKAAREAGGVPEGVVDLNFEKAKGDLQGVADALADAGRKKTGEVKEFPKKDAKEIARLQQKYFDAQRQLDSLEKDVKRGVLEETDPKYLNARRAAEDAINAWHEAEGINIKKQPARAEAIEAAAEKHGGLDKASDALEAKLAERVKDIESGTAKPASFPGAQRLAMTRKDMDAKRAASKPQVVATDKFGNEAKFTGATVHEAAVFARNAGYKPDQIKLLSGAPYVPPKNAAAAPAQASAKPAQTAAAAPPGGGAPPPPTAPPPAGGASTPPPRGPQAASSVDAARQSILSHVAKEASWYSKVPKSKAEAKAAWDKFYTASKNALHPIEQLRKIDPSKITSAEDDFAMLARLTKGLGGRFQQIMKNGTYSILTGKVNGKSLDEVIKPISSDPDGFTAYALSKRVIELEGRGVKTGFNVAEARQVQAADAAKFEPVFRDLHAFQDRVLQNLVDSGVLSDAAATKMRQMNKEYVPFYRMLDPNSELGQQLGSGLQTRNPIFRIKGSDADVFDPINSIIKNTYVFTDLAHRNQALVSMKKFNDSLPADKQFMVRDRSTHPIEVQPQEIQKFLDKHGIEGFADDAMTIFRPNAFTPADDKIRVYNKGKAEVYTVPPEIGKAVNAMDQQSQHLFFKILGTPARLLRAGAIYSPEFMLRNPLRDLVGAFIQSKHGSIPVYDFAVGLKHIFSKSNDFQEWMINGGANANLVSMDRAMLHTNAATMKGVANKVVNPKEWLRMLQDVSELSENATRVGMYARARGKGVHQVEAAFEAREGTLDFARMGASPAARALNSIIPFFNAQVEGTDRFTRAVIGNPLGTLAKTAASVTLPSVLLWFHNQGDERVKELPAWQKDLFWVVPGADKWTPMTADESARWAGKDLSKLTHTIRQGANGLERNDANIWRIPKPFEIGVLFGSVPERMLDAYYDNNPKAFKNLGKTVLEALSPSFVPQAVLPGVEQFANHSIFLDRPLMTEEQKKKSPSQQFGPHTSETSKLLGSVVRSVAGDKSSFGSPIIIDNYIRQWSGGLGAHVVSLIDKAVKSQKDLPPEATKTAADIPGLKAFAVRFPSSSAQSIQDFYEARTERKMNAADIKGLQKTDPTAAAERRKTADTYAGDPFAKMLKADRDAVKRIAADRNMTPDQKRAATDLTYLLMIEHAKQGVAAMERNKRLVAP